MSHEAVYFYVAAIAILAAVFLTRHLASHQNSQLDTALWISRQAEEKFIAFPSLSSAARG